MKTLIQLPMVFVLWCLAATSVAQVNPSVEQGLKPFGSYNGGNIDTVSLTTGNLMLRIPLVAYPQRGKLSLSFSIQYNNKGWSVSQHWVGTTLNQNWTWKGQGVAFGWDQKWSISNITPDTSTEPDFQANGPDGSVHQLAELTFPNPTSFESIDAAGLRYNTSPTTGGFVIDRDGVRYGGGQTINNIGYDYIFDPNGNQITHSVTFANPKLDNGWTDSLGRTIAGGAYFASTFMPGTSTNTANCPSGTTVATVWSVPAPGATTSPFKFCFQDTGVSSTGLPTSNISGPISPGSAAVRFLIGIVLPNLTNWTFSYNSLGDLTQITLPTGGSISYSWTNGNSCGSDITPASRYVGTRTLNDGTTSSTWTYAWVSPPSLAASGSTTVTDPLGNDAVHVVTPIANTCSWYVTRSRFYQGNQTTGALLKTVDTHYSGVANPFNVFNPTDTAANVVADQITTTWPSGQVSKVVKTYDSGGVFYFGNGTNDTARPLVYGSVVHENYNDYGSGGPGALLKQIATSYVWQGNSNYLTANLLNLPSSIVTQDSSGNRCAELDYGYDDPAWLISSGITTQHVAGPNGAYRGNPTSRTRQITNGPCSPGATWSPNAVHTEWYDTGEPAAILDAMSFWTEFTYSTAFAGAYVTQTCYPNTALNITHCIGGNYDLNTGLLTSFTDQNNQSTTYGYDGMWRLATVSFPDAGQIAFSYPNATTVERTQQITATTSVDQFTYVDGLGRTKQTRLVDPDGDIYVEAAYDALGRTRTVSNAHRVAASPTDGTTQYTYDALDRVTVITEQDGNAITTDYSAYPSTTVTDEAGKKRKSRRDALDQIVTVWEDPLGLNYETDYQYDPLGNLIRVDQKGGTIDSTQWRTRTFAYDSVGRLAQASNPESGTIQYTRYDGNDNLEEKWDARGIGTIYTYDELNRLTLKSYSDNTPAVSYSYDQTTYNGLTISNGRGRRTGMSDSSGQTAWTYDAMGRVAMKRQTISGVTKNISFAYNRDGSVKQLTYPSGRILNYTYGPSQRVTSMVDAANIVYNNYVTGAHYAPPGELTSAVHGQGINESNAYNNRLQPTQLSLSAAGSLLNLSYTWTQTGVSNSGNVLRITNNRDNTRSVAYIYDQLNRLASAATVVTTGTNAWGNSYVYDPWGNLLQKNLTQGSGESLTVSVDAHNHITGYSYDAAGNVMSDGNNGYLFDAEDRMSPNSGGQIVYTYDGDNHRVKTAISGTTTLYWYDGNSRPVSVGDGSGSISRDYICFGGKRIGYTSVSSGNTHYYLSDHLGSPRKIVNGDGTSVEWEADYYPFGGKRVLNNFLDTFYLFTGWEIDYELTFGIAYYYYAGSREESTAAGRFLNADPIFFQAAMSSDPQLLNQYAYVRNNPLSFVDPRGEAIELRGDEVERQKEINALCDAVGPQACSYLYVNPVTRTDANGNSSTSYYVGIYTNGLNGNGPSFENINSVSNAFADIIHDSRVAFLDLVKEGTAVTNNQGYSLVIGAIPNSPGQTYTGSDGHLHVTLLDTSTSSPGQLPPNFMSNWKPGSVDKGILAGHEFGHVRYEWGGFWRHWLDNSNSSAVRLENNVRKLRDPGGPTRTRHSTDY